MGNNLRWTPEQLRKKGLVQNEKGDYIPVKSLVNNGKVEKLPNLIDRAIGERDEIEKLVDSVSMGLYGADLIPSLQLDKVFNAMKPNSKVKNATKIEEAGVKFDSKLEKYMYDLLRGAQIDFEFQKVYVLQEKFRYRDGAVRAITLTVDFWLPTRNMIIDTKGFQTQQGAMRWKMLKSYLKNIEDRQPEIILPSTKKECDLLLNRLLYDKP